MIRINDVDVNYVQYGSGQDVVLLHGWGQNILMMQPIGKSLLNVRVTILDLPGFGESSEPSFPYSLDDYVEFLHDFIVKLDIVNPIIIGHSFGAKLALLYCLKYEVRKMVLFAPPIMASKKSVKTSVLKTLRKIPIIGEVGEGLKKYIGSKDYRDASNMMREILIKHVNYDISDKMIKVRVPVLFMWGDKDEAVPLSVGKYLEKTVGNSGLVVLPNSTHYAYMENLVRVCDIINLFVRGGTDNED